ncbi:lambda-crystallin-like [Uloborus diversus]|uniref:lambda-crystallin-like n=1 Tax=Uloborus diversus TaxID=327109 RepID=UPI002409AF3C|nr:lambda-crystallin-like [Uloborus diversus]
MSGKSKIGIVGSGLVGKSWAMLFASAGYKVSIYDNDPKVSEAVIRNIEEQLKKLEGSGLLRGSLSASQQLQLITVTSNLADCVKGAFHVQESVPENVDIKKKVFLELDELADDSVVLCSSTSCIVPSTFSEKLKHRSQVVVAHPANPPYYVPIVEMVPSPWTKPEVVSKTTALMKEIGQKPVVCKKEIYGFAINRMQYAIINECWRLVQDGVMSVEDVDAVMSEGLGMRYAFLGVFETCHLNADGMLDYCRRYAKGIFNVSETFGPAPQMKGPTAENIHKELCEMVPLQQLNDRRKWRDERLACLAKLKKSMDTE